MIFPTTNSDPNCLAIILMVSQTVLINMKNSLIDSFNVGNNNHSNLENPYSFYGLLNDRYLLLQKAYPLWP